LILTVKNIWTKLQSPIFALAPMEEVTDTVFRRVILELGRPSIMFSEFTNCEGVNSIGQARVIHRLEYTDSEKPLIAQVWGITPEDYYKTAKLIVELGFDGLDINMGCPVKKVIRQGACSALIKNPTLAKEIVAATREGLDNKIPLSIKTRIGFDHIQTEQWCGFVLSQLRPDALTIHGRTVKEQSKVANHWQEIGKVVELKKQLGLDTVILGNGDIHSLHQGNEMISQYGLDGVMIGRGVFTNPWIFDPDYKQDKDGKVWRLINQNWEPVTIAQRLDTLKYHVDLYHKHWGDRRKYQPLKRFFKIYIQGFEGAGGMRDQLMRSSDYTEFDLTFDKIRKSI
jgi:nifR3 family TIM-barrel protein